MAPRAEPHASDTPRLDSLDRRLLSTNWETTQRPSRRDYYISRNSIASAPDSRMPIVARAASLDGGEIAGAVVASVIGGSLLILILGFLYFRHRRRVRARSLEEDGLPTKPPTSRRASFPGQGYVPRRTEPSQREGNPSVKDGDRSVAILGDGTDFQQYPSATQSTQQNASAQGFDSSAPPYTQGNSLSWGQSTAAAGAAAASYYDTNISMDSDPDQPTMASPSRQMTEMYQEQLREARERRRERQSSSKGSAIIRLFDRFKRKRSTHLSDVGSARGSPTGLQADIPRASIEESRSFRGEPVLDQSDQRVFTTPSAPGIYEEPQDMSEGVDSDQHHKKKSKWHSSGTSGVAPHRLDSLRTALEREPTLDAQLPSSAMRQNFPENEASSAQASQDIRGRLMSPDIPEPMDLDATGITDGARRSAVRVSHSPPLPTEGFNPMAIMKPSNDAEKAAWNNAELVRIENSSSPPSTSPEYIHEDYQAYDGVDDEDEDADMDDDGDGETDDGMTTIPEIDAPGQTSAASDYSTPPGQSSTNPSDGRTPITQITSSPSPSPNPNNFIKAENTASPEAPITYPKPALTCECGRTFDQVHKLNHHKRYHDRKHECPYEGCDKKFGTKTHLDRHINDKHEKKKGFHCTEPSCAYFKGGKAFPRKDNWRRHMQNKHRLSPQSDPDPAVS